MDILKLIKTVGAICVLMIYYCFLHVVSVLVDWMKLTTSLDYACKVYDQSTRRDLPKEKSKKTGDDGSGEFKNDVISNEYDVLDSKKDV